MTDQIPAIEQYRGVQVHDFQTAERIATIVRPAIDAVYQITDPGALYDYAAEPKHAPEARLFAEAKYRALHEFRAGAHTQRLGRLEMLGAVMAGVNSLVWCDPDFYCSMLERPRLYGRTDIAKRPPDHRERLIAVKRAR